MDRIKGLLIIGVLILAGFLLNHFMFSFGSASHGTHTTEHSPTVTRPTCVLKEVSVRNITISNYYYGVVTLKPLTPFVKVLVLQLPSTVSIVLRGGNTSRLLVYLAIESGSNVTIVSPQLYRSASGSTAYYSLLPPGVASVIVLNPFSKPITVGIEISVEGGEGAG